MPTREKFDPAPPVPVPGMTNFGRGVVLRVGYSADGAFSSAGRSVGAEYGTCGRGGGAPGIAGIAGSTGRRLGDAFGEGPVERDNFGLVVEDDGRMGLSASDGREAEGYCHPPSLDWSTFIPAGAVNWGETLNRATTHEHSPRGSESWEGLILLLEKEVDALRLVV